MVRPSPSPPCERSSACRSCTNVSNILRQHVGRDADAVVAHAEHDRRRARAARSRVILPPGSVYFAALVSRFADHLGQPAAVGVDDQAAPRDVDDERVPLLLEQRARGLDRLRDRRRRFRPARAAAESCRA